MISCINRETCKPCYIDENLIEKMDERVEEVQGRVYPYTRVYVDAPKVKHKYTIDVFESKRKIEELIEQAQTHPKTVSVDPEWR